jgi:renalase
MTKIAIIGTGISGLIAANELNKYSNVEITFFEKSKGVGGRIATRYHEEWEFDHGCPYFEAETSEFTTFLQPLIKKGIIAQWQPKVVDQTGHVITNNNKYFLGIPKMNSLPKALASSCNVHFEKKITKMEYLQNQWHLTDEKSQQYSGFDFVITSTPPAQAYDIISDNCSYKNSLHNYEMLPQFACMLGFNTLHTNFDIMQVQNSKIEKIVLNHKKNGRMNKPSLVIYSSIAWASENIDTDKTQIGNELLLELEYLLKQELEPHMVQTHRWLYSRAKNKSDPLFLSDDNLNMLSCGDWLSNGTIEGAFLSGMKTAQYRLEK